MRAKTTAKVRSKQVAPSGQSRGLRRRFRIRSTLPAALCLLLSLSGALYPAAGQSAASGEIVPTECLVIPPVGRYGRVAVHTDAVEEALVTGRCPAPREGDTVTLPDGIQRTWERLSLGRDGAFASPALQGGYAAIRVDLDRPELLLLEAAAHSMAYINGEPRMGDPYDYGYVRLPVQLKAGRNDLLFPCARGRFRVRLTRPRAPAMLDTRDATLPDLIPGERDQVWAAVVALNTTAGPADGLWVRAESPGGRSISTRLPPLPPLAARKVGFRLDGVPPSAAGTAPYVLTLLRRRGGRMERLDRAEISLRVRRSAEPHKRTFLSAIDGSVQYYAVTPALPGRTPGRAPALFLSLHGASVEAMGQAGAYSGKSWGHIVAPTNRRPYGFDWEDWGRMDALEVMDLAQQRLHTDPTRSYLTGHSMGGHGTWSLGALFPDRFAAIGPSAGWISFSSYAGGPRPTPQAPVEELLLRASATSDTLALARNYAQEGIYILHGDADDNVPVTQARTMVRELNGFHHDFRIHEQPGAGHWWDASDEPGADCVDWAPLFDFFAHHALPEDVNTRQVDFVTVNPGISARSHWVCIEAQQQALHPSSVSLRYDPGRRRYVGTTENVTVLTLSLGHMQPKEPFAVNLDGQKLEGIPWPSGALSLTLARRNGIWSVDSQRDAGRKGPARSGPFKEAFRNRMLFVYGTKGTPEENAWALAKARYDAEVFWYRGNGSIDVLPDVQFDPKQSRDRNVVLYGHADSNSAWPLLLAGSPVTVRRGRIVVGTRTREGADLAALFVRPRQDSPASMVAVVAGTGIIGMRLTDRLPYFVSGVGFPDFLLLGANTLQSGLRGVLAAGYFGLHWDVESGEFAWRNGP